MNRSRFLRTDNIPDQSLCNIKLSFHLFKLFSLALLVALMYSSVESCSPTRRRDRRDRRDGRDGGGGSVKSCFSYQSLARIARRFNEANPSKPIPMLRSRDELWHAIRQRIPECKDERCWIQSRWVTDGDRTTIEEDFKPPIPQGKYAWLNSDDIYR